MRACVPVFVHVAAAFLSVQAPDPVFPHPLYLPAFSLIGQPLGPSSPFTPPQVAIISCIILMSRLHALLLTDEREKEKRQRQDEGSSLSLLPSPASTLRSPLSAGRQGGGLAL